MLGCIENKTRQRKLFVLQSWELANNNGAVILIKLHTKFKPNLVQRVYTISFKKIARICLGLGHHHYHVKLLTWWPMFTKYLENAFTKSHEVLMLLQFLFQSYYKWFEDAVGFYVTFYSSDIRRIMDVHGRIYSLSQ